MLHCRAIEEVKTVNKRIIIRNCILGMAHAHMRRNKVLKDLKYQLIHKADRTWGLGGRAQIAVCREIRVLFNIEVLKYALMQFLQLSHHWTFKR